MMKLVFFYVCIIVCLTHNLFGQLTETALTNNPQLSRINSSARNSQDDVVKLFLITGSTIQYCPHSNLIEGEIARLEYGECTTLAHGFFVAGDVCSEYTNDGSVGTDVICLTICDSLDNCRNLEIHFTSREAMSLPFIDDFSNGSTDPDPVLWIDQDVFINNSLAERALSLGVATFDGLDEGGTPYESGAGYSDALTSTFLDLSTANIVFVSFFVQPKGFGLKPREQDSIVLDFKSTGGEWIRVWQREGLPSSFSSRNPAPDFSFESVEVADSFRYAGFQFRFRNKSKNEGLQELWHLDYVRVTSQIPPSESIEDIAFVKPPKGVLKTYSAMPWAQFAGSEVDEVTDELQIEIYNHFDEVETANPSRLLMNEQVTETSLISNLTLLEVPPIANENQRNLSPGRHQFTNDLDPGRFINTLISIQPVDQELRIETIYEFEQDQETNNGIAAILRNNRTSAMTVLSDYYAYDDGTAESAIIDRGSNQMTRLAIEFEANVSDSLKGVQVVIP
ncbi:MAG: hypothetical protein OEQ53_13785, partial [Saprospiraceae bacterium]|nr:hypothetical protein [Saprospiraceae bacterium]